VKRPKRVPSSSWSPTMKGTLAYFPALMRTSGDAERALPSGLNEGVGSQYLPHMPVRTGTLTAGGRRD
jgi:hypothetical protein